MIRKGSATDSLPFLIMTEMEHRGFNCDFERFEQWIDKPYELLLPDYEDLFKDWHNDRYLMQCFFNLQEKFDCGGIPEDEWLLVAKTISDFEMKTYIKRMNENE